jgi:hypothetical protein
MESGKKESSFIASGIFLCEDALANAAKLTEFGEKESPLII